jgi:glycosyltransferase involved in cell wall biosynthesis
VKIAMIIGRCPEGQCGVGDYARVLAATLCQSGLTVEVLEKTPRVNSAAGVARPATAFPADLVHIQYPTAGFGKSLAPQLFSIRHRFLLTAHEFQDTHILRRLAFYPLFMRAQHLIFTTAENRDCALQWAPWLQRNNSVIPLSTNIPKAATRNGNTDGTEVLHFGLIRPGKGIEQVIEFARIARAERLPISVRIVGSPQAGDGTYLQTVRTAAVGLPITWELNLPAEEVAQRLGQAAIAYQPFPDGASEKRASLLAALANGAAVITTRGRYTPSALQDGVCFCSSPGEAVAAARKLLHDNALRNALSLKGQRYAQKFSWEQIAEAHIRLYQQLLSNHAHRY